MRHGQVSANMLRKTSDVFVRMPDPLVIAIFLTVFTFASALLLTLAPIYLIGLVFFS